MTTKKSEPDEDAHDSGETAAPEMSAPKEPAARSREPKGEERPEDEVKVAFLDSNRQELRRDFVPKADAGAFRIFAAGQWWERAGTTEDGIASYVMV